MSIEVHDQPAEHACPCGHEGTGPQGDRAMEPNWWSSAPMQILCSEAERRALTEAASIAGLTTSSYMVAAALAFAGTCVAPPISADHALLRETVRLGNGLTQTIHLLRKAVAAASGDCGVDATSLRTALHHCVHTVGSLDQLTCRLQHRLPWRGGA